MSNGYLTQRVIQRAVALFSVMVWFCIVAAVLSAQQEGVPRLVYVELEAAQSDLLSVLAEMIYLQAAAHEVLLRSPSPEATDSVLRVELEQDAALLRVLLLNEDAVHEVHHELQDQEPSFGWMLEIIGPTVAQLLPHLGPVERTREEAELTLRRRQAEAAEILAFEDRLATPWQLSLFFGEIRQVEYREESNDGVESEVHTLVASPFLPVIVELARFRSRNFAVLGRLQLDYNSNTGFYSYSAVAREFDGDDGDERWVDAWDKTQNIIILPGIGIMYRSLGRLAMDFTLLYSLGVAHVTALDRVTMERDGRLRDGLEEGESTVFLYQLLTLQPGLSYAVNESWAVRAALSLNFDPRVLVGGTVATPYAGGASSLLRWLHIGVARRF